jgi:hypothetical protein
MLKIIFFSKTILHINPKREIKKRKEMNRKYKAKPNKAPAIGDSPLLLRKAKPNKKQKIKNRILSSIPSPS